VDNRCPPTATPPAIESTPRVGRRRPDRWL